jgi:DDE family transposase
VLIRDLFASIAPRVARPGPAPSCTDAELITMAIVGACCGWDQETVLLSHWRDQRDLFPQQPERSRFNRRRRDLARVINLVRPAILQVLDLTHDAHCSIDSLPVPGVQLYFVPQASVEWQIAGATFGHCCSKKHAIFGYKLHLLITQSGVIRDFELAPANLPDLTVGSELLAADTDLQVLGDKGYISQSVAANRRAQRTVALVTVPRGNQRCQPSREFRHLHAHLRQLIETVNRPLALQFHIETNHAHSFRGLTARLSTKLTAHTLCVWLKRLLGVADVLHLKALAFPLN